MYGKEYIEWKQGNECPVKKYKLKLADMLGIEFWAPRRPPSYYNENEKRCFDRGYSDGISFARMEMWNIK